MILNPVGRLGIKESLFVIGFLLLVLIVSSRFGILFGGILAVIGIILWKRWRKKNEINRKSSKS